MVPKWSLLLNQCGEQVFTACLVLFRLVSTELLEGDFYTCADTKRDTELAKIALLEEKQEKHLGL